MSISFCCLSLFTSGLYYYFSFNLDLMAARVELKMDFFALLKSSCFFTWTTSSEPIAFL